MLKANGSPSPEFETDAERSYFIVTIKPHEGFDGDDGVNDGGDGVNDGDDGLNDGDDDINRQRNILLAMKQTPNISVRQLAEMFGVSRSTIEREIKKMKQTYLIKRLGSAKSGYWEVME